MKKTLSPVTIIIVNFNGKKYLNACFDSLLRLDYPAGKVEIIMVDNGSTDDSIRFVRAKFPNIKIIKNNVNNYCRANNLGIKVARGDYIALLNNDTRVDRHWLKELVKVMERNKSIGALSSKILFMDGKIQSTGHQEYPNFYWGDRGFKEKDRGQYNRLEEVTSICGGAVLYRKNCLEDVGLLDEDFVMYLDDVDMAIRCRKKNWKMFYVPRSIVYHVYSGTATNELQTYYIERNRLLLIAKHYPKDLVKSFYGRGYFSKENFKKLNEVMSVVIAKLTQHHKPIFVQGIVRGLFDELDRLKNLKIDNFYKEMDRMKEEFQKKNEALISMEKTIAKMKQTEDELKHKNAILKQKDRLLKEKDRLIKERDRLIRQKDGYLKRNADLFLLKDKDIMSRDAVIRKKDELIASLEKSVAQMKEIENEIKQKDRLLKEKDRLIKERDRLIRQKDDYLKRNADLFLLKDKDIMSRDAVIRKKDEVIASLEKKVARMKEMENQARSKYDEINKEFIKKVEDTANQLREKEKELLLKDQKIYNLNVELSYMLEKFQQQSLESEAKGKLIKEKDAIIRDRDKLILAKDKELNERNESLMELHRENDRLNYELKQKESLVADITQDIASKDKMIINLEQEMKNKDSHIMELNIQLARISADINVQIEKLRQAEDKASWLLRNNQLLEEEKKSIIIQKDSIIEDKDKLILAKDKELNERNESLMQLYRENDRLNYEVKKKIEDEEVYKEEITRLKEEIEEMNKLLHLKELELNERNTKILELNYELKEKSKELICVEKEFEAFKEKSEELMNSKDKQLDEQKIKMSEIEHKMRASLLEKDEKITRLNKDIDVVKSEKERVIKDRDREISLRDDLIIQKDGYINKKNKAIEEKDKTLTEFRKQMDNMLAEIDILSAKIKTLNSDIQQKDIELSRMKKDLVAFQNSFSYKFIYFPFTKIKTLTGRYSQKIKNKIRLKKITIRKIPETFPERLKNNRLFIRFYDSNNPLSKSLQAIHRRNNHWLTTYKIHLKTGKNPPPPEILILMLTKRCNLRCEFCDIYDSTEEMNTEDAIKVIDNVSRTGIRLLVITGGEPFLHRGLFTITRHAKDKGLNVCITTNGTLILDKINEITSSGVDTLSVSLDGLGETHDLMRGKKGVFEKIQQGIDKLRSINRCNVALNFVFTKKNISDLEKVYTWSKERNIFFDFWPVNYCRDLYINQNGDYDILAKFTKKLKNRGEIRRCKFYYYRQVPLYLEDKIRLRVRCLGLSRQLGVDVNGDVMPCCVWGKDKISLGNAIHDDMVLLWNSRRYYQVRHDIFYKGCSSGCYNHSLHEFMTITGHNFIVAKQRRKKLI